MSGPYKIAAFYRFAPLPDFRALQPPLLDALKALGICGSVLLAEEGINGTIAGLPEEIDQALGAIAKITAISSLEPKFSFAGDKPFRRMKVRLKKEIVTIGNVRANPNEKVGTYVEPADWNALISAPDVVVIDTRNDYEFGVGTFKGALDPQTESFSEFPLWVREKLKAKPETRIAMFCTGGIRCEKASAFMLNEGFENVFHLKGGILKYLEQVPQEQSLWEGGCFVFDERVAVGHGLEVMDFTMCHGCLKPVSAGDRLSPLYEEGVCCPSCAASLTPEQKASNRERQKQVNLASKRGAKHLGPVEG
ncbi:rhodanese-related sulfurtransferase [Aestuariivirga litoralis]|uniref:oxygen-dependent tRNA uridine(34) hydroxylase TrhO n=1 Tax=Aestuariivirga litoralis TaxID=2650924 RepID=UPI0018C56A16|nr:rhodanese-related sulfurtransferase [Aestuariivirga litoralis]MBG1232005.1 rhodanese-related sulfurtransferase [Aestuariivirga litoralis]